MPINTTKILRLEGFFTFILMCGLYQHYALDWTLFFYLFLFPDLSFLGYLSSPRHGAITYNLAHTYSMPLILCGLGVGFNELIVLSISLIWMAHIGFDRALGYGLKSTANFHTTHLGTIGKQHKTS